MGTALEECLNREFTGSVGYLYLRTGNGAFNGLVRRIIRRTGIF